MGPHLGGGAAGGGEAGAPSAVNSHSGTCDASSSNDDQISDDHSTAPYLWPPAQTPRVSKSGGWPSRLIGSENVDLHREHTESTPRSHRDHTANTWLAGAAGLCRRREAARARAVGNYRPEFSHGAWRWLAEAVRCDLGVISV